MKRLYHIFVFCFFLLTGTNAIAQNVNIFTGKDAATIITEAIAKQDAIGDIKISINDVRDEDIITQGAGTITAAADAVTLDKARNHWEATLMLQSNGQNLAPIRLVGRYDEMVAVPVLKRRMQSSDVISQDDIDWDKEPAIRIRKTTITDPHDLIGKSPKHTITQGRAIRLDEIASPAIVSKGSQVTMMFKTQSIEIKTYGEALEPGAKGDVIRVRNTTSKTIVEATVEASDRVRVTSPGIDAAEVTP